MIYLSSSNCKAPRITDSIEELVGAGFRNIELSGGSNLYPELEADLLQAKADYSLNLQLHNYFPPPEKHFVLNLASSDEVIYQRTLEHLKKAIDLSQTLGATRYGFHAGFLIDIKAEEAGQGIRKRSLIERQEGIDRFCRGFEALKQHADGIDLYIENNVISRRNLENFEGRNPFLLTDHEGLEELGDQINFKLLLDVAHLKVSCQSLGLDFSDQLALLMPEADYVHISDNDGMADQNNPVESGSELLREMAAYDYDRKTMTIEVYDQIENIKRSYDSIQRELFTT